MKKLIILMFFILPAIISHCQTTDQAKSKLPAKASLDTAFNAGSGIAVSQLSNTQTEDLTVLGKVWGFLKYYHPAIAAGNYNWDYELFRVMPKVLSSKSQTERNLILYNWVKNLGDFKTTKLPDTLSIRYKPNFQWVRSSTFGQDLTSLLTKIITAERSPENYYVKLYSEEMPIPFFMNEAPYSKFKYPDAGFRLLSLYRYWNMIEYFYPYKITLNENWDQVLRSFIPRYVAAENELNYKLVVSALITSIKDSHASLSGGRDMSLYTHMGAFRLAVEITFVGSKPIVSKSLDEISGNNSGLLKGDEIISINNKPIEAILKEQLPITSASNYPTQLSRISVNLLRTKDSLINIGFKRAGKVNNIDLKAVPLSKSVIKTKTEDADFKMLNADVAYIHPGKLQVKYLDSIMKIAMKSKTIIIDMRTYPRETMFTMIMANYLFSKPTDFCRMTKGNVISPGTFSYLNDNYMINIKIGKENPDYYKGKVIVLANEVSQSFAEMTLMAFKAGPNTTIIGSQTAGADGNVTPPISLPGGITTIFTGIGVYYLNGKETQRIGIIPDIEVKPSIEGIKSGKDEVLERALAFASKS